jgi:tRNA 2-selenouridine synthase
MDGILEIDEFLNKGKEGIFLDARSPAEYASGHIPGAISFPLFDNEERAIIGTSYKKQGKEAAVEKGLEIVGPKLAGFVRTAREKTNSKNIFLYCWRGGMRSGSLAWLLRTAGFRVYTLKGGYKIFRRSVLAEFKKKYNLLVLGGKTGTGKTEILKIIAEKGFQVLDLEGLAHHKGSSFGALGQEQQPRIEHFENKMYIQLREMNTDKPLWVEDESRNIGTCSIPLDFWNQMRVSPVFFIDSSLDYRVKRLINEYACFEKKQLAEAIQRISRRIGGQNEKAALLALDVGDFVTVSRIMLDYYDKSYYHGLSKRDPNSVYEISVQDDEPQKIAEKAINIAERYLLNAGNKVNSI